MRKLIPFILTTAVCCTAQSFEVSTHEQDAAVADTQALQQITVRSAPAASFTRSSTFYNISVAASVVGSSFDIASSLSRPIKEANPILGTSGRYSTTSALLTCGITGGTLILQHWVLKHHPEKRRTLAIINFIGSGAHAAIGLHNLSLR